MIDEPVTAGQMIDGELFEWHGEIYEVLENRGTRYILAQRRTDGEIKNIEQNQLVEPL